MTIYVLHRTHRKNQDENRTWLFSSEQNAIGFQKQFDLENDADDHYEIYPKDVDPKHLYPKHL